MYLNESWDLAEQTGLRDSLLPPLLVRLGGKKHMLYVVGPISWSNIQPNNFISAFRWDYSNLLLCQRLSVEDLNIILTLRKTWPAASKSELISSILKDRSLFNCQELNAILVLHKICWTFLYVSPSKGDTLTVARPDILNLILVVAVLMIFISYLTSVTPFITKAEGGARFRCFSRRNRSNRDFLWILGSSTTRLDTILLYDY